MGKQKDNNGIYKRPDSPYWWATWQHGGRTCRRSTQVKVSDDPRGHLAKKVRAGYITEEPKEAPKTGRTWGDLLELWLDGPLLKMAPATQRRYLFALKPLDQEFNGRELAGIAGRDVRAYIAKRNEEGVSPVSEISLITAIVNWGILELEWAIPNPWARRKPSKAAPRERWLTKEEADRLIDAARGKAKDFIMLCLATGLRPGEALQLEWRRVDFDAGVIRFDAGGGTSGQKNGKAGSVPINAMARQALMARRNPTRWVFPGEGDNHLTNLRKGFDNAVRRAGLTDVHQHDLRRTAGSWLAQAGVPIQQIAALLRHSDINLTHSTYAHLAPSTLADTVEMLDQRPKLRIVK